MREGFSSFQELSRRAAGRDLVLFGAGNIATKTRRRLERAVAGIADSNPSLWQTGQHGVEIRDPAWLRELEPRPFVVICTTSFAEVAAELERMGYAVERDFMVSPVLNDLRIISDIESHACTLLFTSGCPPGDDPRNGGGIYELRLDGEWSYRKVYSGNCHGLIAHGDGWVVVDDAAGLVELDARYAVVRSQPLPPGARGHGVARSAELGRFYVACTYLDAILVYDDDWKAESEISLSRKLRGYGEPCHHCNDVCVIGGHLYVSMFSHSGNWKRDVFDGVVLEIDLEEEEILEPVIRDLWMPHSVDLLDGSIVVLDSLRGRYLKGNAQPVGIFPGFTRGLASDGVFTYLGQSRNRNYSSRLGLSMNISIDTSILVFDEQTKVSRSLSLPSSLSEIHAIRVVQS